MLRSRSPVEVLLLTAAMLVSPAALPEGIRAEGDKDYVFESGRSPGGGRIFHASTALADGRVLVAGGNTNAGPDGSVVIYDPARHAWSTAATMPGAPWSHF